MDECLNRLFSHASPFDRSAARVGRYQVKARLASGGMAEVYAAERDSPSCPPERVALKRMRPSLSCDPHYVQLFMDEARLGMRLSHPNICRVQEFVRAEGEYCIAMEYLHGVTLSHLALACRRAGRVLPQSIVLGIVEQACEGLHYAHELQDEAGHALHVIHRDVSPQNVMICVDGAVKVLDFGIAKAESSEHVTITGSLKGKSSYMSPEQLFGEPLDRRTDVWSLGVVLLEALNGHNPFRRGSLAETACSITYGPMPRLDDLLACAPAALRVVVSRALSRNLECRYGSTEELRLALVGSVGESHIATQETIGAFIRDLCGPTLDAREQLFESAPSRVPVGLEAKDDADATISWSCAELSSPERTPKSASHVRAPARRTEHAPEPSHPSLALALGSSVRCSPWGPRTLRAYALARRSSVVASTLSALAVAVLLLARPLAERSAVLSSAAHVLTPDVVSAPRSGALVQGTSPAEQTLDAEARREMRAVAGAPREVSASDDPEQAGPARRKHRSATSQEATRRERRREAQSTQASEARAPGLLFVDAEPYATIYVDGQSLGVTPILGASVPEGRHKLRAVTADGRVKELVVRVSAEEPLRRRLRW